MGEDSPLTTVVGQVKSATFKREANGKWFVSLVVIDPTPVEPKVRVDSDRAVAVDLGVVDFAVLSDGRRIPSPRFQRRSSVRLRRLHRELSRKKRGSKSRARARARLAREFMKVRNRRMDFLHRLSSELISHHDAICIEDLGVTGLARTKLARAIYDSGWGEFRRQLVYKADWAGKRLVVAPRFFPSSKLCSNCGRLNRNLLPRERRWTCACGAIHDRDLNAATNLLDFGLSHLVAAGLADTENARGADVRLPLGAVRGEAGIRAAPEGQHASARPTDG